MLAGTALTDLLPHHRRRKSFAPSKRVLYSDGVLFLNHPGLVNGLKDKFGKVLAGGILMSD